MPVAMAVRRSGSAASSRSTLPVSHSLTTTSPWKTRAYTGRLSPVQDATAWSVRGSHTLTVLSNQLVVINRSPSTATVIALPSGEKPMMSCAA